MGAERIAQIVGGWATLIASIIGAIALIYAWLQVEAAKEIWAKETYRSFIDMAIEYPEYSAPNLEKIRSNSRTYEQYEWFVAHMLLACEEILDNFGNEVSWRESCLQQVCYHEDYLKSSSFSRVKKTYSIEFLDMIDKKIKSGCDEERIDVR